MKVKTFSSDSSAEALEKKVNEWLGNNDVEVFNTHMTESKYGITMAIFYYERAK